jgi:hypothetical protein
MKANKLLLAALFLGVASLAFAGPGPDYWTRTQKKQNEPVQIKAPAAPAKVCASCSCTDSKKA